MVSNPVDEYLDYLKIEKRYSEYTITKYRMVYNSYGEYMQTLGKSMLSATSEDMRNYIYVLYNFEYESTTISNYISSLKSLYKYLANKEIIEENISKDINYPKKKAKLYKIVYGKELKMFFQSISDYSKLKERDTALFLILYTTGIRVSECANLKLNDIDYCEKVIKVYGKGKKERIVPVKKEVLEKLENYIIGQRNTLIKSKAHEYVFVNNLGDPLTTRGIRYITTNVCNKSSESLKISPHVFRHTLATTLLNNGMNLRSIQTILGHETLSTTEKYTHLSKDDLKKQYNELMTRK